NSMFFDEKGNLQKILPSFIETVEIIDTKRINSSIKNQKLTLDNISSVYKALILGLRDYVRKCGFTSVLLGLSGGIDSALTAVIATEAVGAKNVWGITMPSRYSSEGSIKDSEELAKRLGIKFSIIPIEDIFSSFLSTLKPIFGSLPENVAEENLQARIRGTILMAISNKFSNYLLVSTGNKSELSVGYSTLYGDMNGGLAVISDVPKKMVYELANYINREKEIIPQSIIKKAPSAELRYNQKDEDTLPPYSILDPIIEAFIEQNKSIKQIVAEGFEESTVRWVANAIAKSEYKRKQAPPGLKITSKAFGSGRRFPIAARYERNEVF
ncbi:MAG: NAD(+) synthase, partial [Chitinispirillaceae bacterium]|nr:NAD(+) synthase [Chitinispirillaceae bacterium]